MNTARAISDSKRRRRGTVYLFALGACGLVVVAGVTAVRIAGVGLSSQSVSRDADLAGREADGAMHLVAEVLASDPSGAVWRADSRYQLNLDGLSGAAKSGSVTTLRIEMIDPADNDLRDDPTERVSIKAVATAGDVQRTREFQVDPVVTNLACLSHTLLYGTMDVAGGATSSVNGSQAALSSAQVKAPRVLNAAAIRKSTGIEITSQTAGDSVANANSLLVPTIDSILAAFRARGASEVKLSSDLTLDKELVSPTRFSPGTPHARGLYIIDANGRKVVIKDSRIDATLLIFNAAKTRGVQLEGAVAMEPAEAGLPTLIVGGDVEMKQTTADLLESSVGRNLNPVGAPYRDVTDADSADAYPSLIQGLVYVHGNLTVAGAATIHGQLFVTGQVAVKDRLLLRPDLIETSNPVLGFSMSSAMRLVPASVTGN